MAFYNTAFFRDTVVHTFSRFAGALFAFLLNVIAMRLFSSFDYGRFAFCLAVMAIGIEAAGKGMDPGVIKISASYLRDFRDRALGILKAGFVMRMAAATILILILAVAGHIVIGRYLKRDELILPFNYALIGLVLMSPLTYFFTVMQSLELLNRWALLNIFLFLGRVLLVLFLTLFLTMNLSNVLLAYMSVTFLSILLGLYLTKPGYLIKRYQEPGKSYSELIHFSKWTMLSTIFYIVYSKTDILFLTAYAGSSEAGIYSAAVIFTFAIDMLTVSLASVLLPKVSKFNNDAQRKQYMLKMLAFASIMAVVLSPVFFMSDSMITLAGGGEFAGSGILFKILYIGPFFTILTALSVLMFYNFNHPALTVLVSTIILPLNIIGHVILIPRFGAKGAAIVTVLSRTVEGLITFAVAYYLIQRDEARSASMKIQAWLAEE